MSILFPFLFVVAAIITKKDLAWITAGASWFAVGLGYTAKEHDWMLHTYITGAVSINFIVGLVAYHHWKKSNSSTLERSIVWLCAASVVTYALPIAGYFDASTSILLSIQALTLAAIMFLPGKKDFGNGLARLIADSLRFASRLRHSIKRWRH